MRLLRLEEDGGLSLTQHKPSDIPPYAILSHRWGRNEDEITFQDLMEDTGRDKLGYQKVLACGKQAARDGLSFFWVDTCCIDKSSSAELSEAINSMWRWYRESTVCYAYLDDVTNSQLHTARSKIARSKWFTRGWTLQELLAPHKVIFYDHTWDCIGTRDELAIDISAVTKINRYYLGKDPSSLERASIAERMSWASARNTTRPEDIAYCLLGIFNISMPLLYGEGKRAFQRLQEEIMKQSDDQSICAWSALASGRNDGLLAQSPAVFQGCGNIVRSINPGNIEPYAVTNRGLRIEFPLLKRGKQTLAGLNCRFAHDFFSDLSIPLEQMNNGYQYRRAHGDVRAISINNWRHATKRSIYVRTTPREFLTRSDPDEGSIIIRNLPNGFRIVVVLPQKFWVPESHTTDESLPRIFTQSRNDPILVIVDTETPHDIAFMVSSRKDNRLQEPTSVARLLPAEATCNLPQMYSQWRSRSLSQLPRSRKTRLGVIILRATNRLVRGRKLTVIDVLVVKNRYQTMVEFEEYLRSITQSAFYQLTRALGWLSDLKHNQFFHQVMGLILAAGLMTGIIFLANLGRLEPVDGQIASDLDKVSLGILGALILLILYPVSLELSS